MALFVTATFHVCLCRTHTTFCLRTSCCFTAALPWFLCHFCRWFPHGSVPRHLPPHTRPALFTCCTPATHFTTQFCPHGSARLHSSVLRSFTTAFAHTGAFAPGPSHTATATPALPPHYLLPSALPGMVGLPATTTSSRLRMAFSAFTHAHTTHTSWLYTFPFIYLFFFFFYRELQLHATFHVHTLPIAHGSGRAWSMFPHLNKCPSAATPATMPLLIGQRFTQFGMWGRQPPAGAHLRLSPPSVACAPRYNLAASPSRLSHTTYHTCLRLPAPLLWRAQHIFVWAL